MWPGLLMRAADNPIDGGIIAALAIRCVVGRDPAEHGASPDVARRMFGVVS